MTSDFPIPAHLSEHIAGAMQSATTAAKAAGRAVVATAVACVCDYFTALAPAAAQVTLAPTGTGWKLGLIADGDGHPIHLQAAVSDGFTELFADALTVVPCVRGDQAIIDIAARTLTSQMLTIDASDVPPLTSA